MEYKNAQLSKNPIKVSDMGFIGTNPIAHLLVFIRRDSLNFLYDKNLENGKDFDLWKRVFVKGFLKKKV